MDRNESDGLTTSCPRFHEHASASYINPYSSMLHCTDVASHTTSNRCETDLPEASRKEALCDLPCPSLPCMRLYAHVT